MRVLLSVTAGPLSGEHRVFEEPDFFTVGRHENCHFALPDDPYLSRHHFILEISPPDVLLRDLGSLNGTSVNGVKYGGRAGKAPGEGKGCAQAIPLKHGDLVKVGRTEMRVHLEMAAFCTGCRREIADEEKSALEFVGGTWLCNECRARGVVAEDSGSQGEAAVSGGSASPDREPSEIIDEILGIFGHGSNPGERLPDIAGYRIIRKLGMGGFGAVYLALHRESGKEVALKTMLQTKNPGARNLLLFTREVEVMRALVHPHIVRILDYGQSGSVHYFALELMDQGSLWDLMIRRGGIISPGEGVPILHQALLGLAHAHAKGFIHRDIKPSNILLSMDGGKLTARISDFGLSKSFTRAGMTRDRITETGDFVGSPSYIAPEHILNYRFVKPETDVFELAATFYHVLTGVPVWDLEGKDLLTALLEEPVKPVRSRRSDIPQKLAVLLDKALHSDPGSRYRDAGEMSRELKKIM